MYRTVRTVVDHFLALGINKEAMYKILSVASMGLDTLPHCPTFVMMAAVCGVTTKASYKHVMVMTVITPIVLATVSPMDKHGYMTLSVSAIYERDLINADALTIVEDNPKGAVVTTSRNDVDYVVTTGKAVLLPPKESVDK